MPRRASRAESDFELALLGYHRGQVDRHIDELNRQLNDALLAFDAAVALQQELNAARNEIRDLRKVATNYPEHVRLGEQITEILMLAEEQAAAIRAEAEVDAEAIRARAGRDAAAIAEAEHEAGVRARPRSHATPA